MNNQELTPRGYDQYHGSMSNMNGSESSIPQEGDVNSEASIEPENVTNVGGDLIRCINDGQDIGEGPKTDADSYIKEKHKQEGSRPLTRDELKKIAQTIQSKPTAGEVLQAAQFVATAAKILVHNITQDKENYQVNKGLFEKFQDERIASQAEELTDFIKEIGPGGGQTVNEEVSLDRRANVLAKAKDVARLADQIANYYEKAKLSKEYDDPFRQVVSFEELMTKFNITMSDDRFRPGGEFSLLDVREYEDAFGREMSEETAHPENFARWVFERAEFYHDFDPMDQIKLFEGMYLVAGSRKVSMYEMLVDFPAYFSHRVQTYRALRVQEEDFLRAERVERFVRVTEEEAKRMPKGVIGYYTKFTDIDNKERRAFVRPTGELKERSNSQLYEVFYIDDKEQEVPVRALLQNKEEWDTESNPEYEKAQEEIMYQLWLQTRNHNADVAYRQKGMQSEVSLKETMAELCADNIWTRTSRRLGGILNMPATTKRIRRKPDGTWEWFSEASVQWNGELKHQGSVGKAFQRSLAAYYHISEANAAFNNYTIEGDNPFFEMLRKGDMDGAEIFYKSLIRRSLFEDSKFGYIEEGFNAEEPKTWGKAKIDVEFFQTLNTIRVLMPDGTTRVRLDWEKADFFDFITLSREDFLQKMQDRNITNGTLREAFKELRKKYELMDHEDKPLSSDSQEAKTRQKKLDELADLENRLDLKSQERKKQFIDSFKERPIMKSEYSRKGDFDERGNEVEKDGIFYKYFHGKYGETAGDADPELKNLAGFAVAIFGKSFSSEFTSDINPYANPRYSLEARERMRRAMRDTLSYTEELDSFDAKWAEEWAFTFTYHTGISARNDMKGIGHDAWSKIQNTEFYRLSQTGGKNNVGNLDNLYGIHRLGTNMWEGLKVQLGDSNVFDTTLYEILTGFDRNTGKFDINRDVPQFEFAGNAMRQYFADHLSHVIDLFVDITQKHEFNFNKIVSKDTAGRLVINHEEMQKLIDNTWKHLRYGFDNNAFLYDNKLFGWWYDEKISQANGQVSRTPHFGVKTLRNLMFSQEVQKLRMYEREDVSGWGESGSDKNKMARNIYAYLIMAQFKEHTRLSGRAELYTADQISLIVTALMEISARVMRGEHGEAISLSGFFTQEEMMRILVMANAVIWQLYAKEYGFDVSGGFWLFIFQIFSVIMKESGAGITLNK